MARALIWEEDDAFDPEDVLIVFSDRKESFLEYKEMGLLEAPLHTVYVAERGKGCLRLILHYLETVKRIPISNSDDFPDTGFDLFLKIWRQKVLCQPNHLESIDRSVIPGLLFSAPALFEVSDLITEARVSRLRSGLISGLRSNHFLPKWWTQKTNYHEALTSVRNRLREHNIGERVKARLINYVSEQEDFWRAYNHLDQDERFLFGSSFCFASSKFYSELSSYDTALTLLHRSCDLRLQYLGISENVIFLLEDGPRYSRRLSHKMVGLDESIRVLSECQIISLPSDSKRVLKRLNECRNKLLLTHSGYSISREEFFEYESSVFAILKNLDQHGKLWSEYISRIRSVPKFTDEDIYSAEEDFDAFVRLVGKTE